MAILAEAALDARSGPYEGCYYRVNAVSVHQKGEMVVEVWIYPTTPSEEGPGVAQVMVRSFEYDLLNASGNLWQQAYEKLKTEVYPFEDV
jgi:hypothetical protein